MRSVLLKAFAKYGAQEFSEKYWIQLIHEGSRKKRVEYCVDHKNSLCHLRAIEGHSGGFPIAPELMGYTSVPHNWNIYSSQKLFVGCSIFLGSGLIPGGKERDKSQQAVFFTLLNPFVENPDEEEPHDDYSIPQKVHCHNYLKRNQDAVSRAQDQGLQFWQTKSHAIIVHSPVPAGCIYKVISRNGDRILLERLSTPRPAPKVTLKRYWHSQQQQCRVVQGDLYGRESIRDKRRQRLHTG